MIKKSRPKIRRTIAQSESIFGFSVSVSSARMTKPYMDNAIPVIGIPNMMKVIRKFLITTKVLINNSQD